MVTTNERVLPKAAFLTELEEIRNIENFLINMKTYNKHNKRTFGR